MIIEPVALGYYLFCNINHEGVTCSRVVDEEYNQKTYVSQTEINEGNIIIILRDNQIYRMRWNDIESCRTAMDGFARCIFIPLPNSRKK